MRLSRKKYHSVPDRQAPALSPESERRDRTASSRRGPRHKGYLAAHRPRILLPPVLAVVLCNGERPWKAPLSLAELFKPIEGYTPPDFKYVVLDVNRYRPGVFARGYILHPQARFSPEPPLTPSARPRACSTGPPGDASTPRPGPRRPGRRAAARRLDPDPPASPRSRWSSAPERRHCRSRPRRP